MSTEDMIRALVTSQATLQATVVQNQQEIVASIQNLEIQMGQMATTINRIQARDSVPQRENVSVVSLRNGRQLEEVEKRKKQIKTPTIHEQEEKVVEEIDEKVDEQPLPIYEPEVPFPEALKSTRKIEKDNDIYETFRHCEDKGPKGKVSEYVSVLFQKKLPPKYSDPGMFAIPCTIGDLRFEKAMLDLGASINVIPYAIYEKLKLGPLKDTSVVIQLADRSSVYPKGVVENIMVGIGKLVFSADFYVLDTKSENDVILVLFGRSFLKTAGTKIDVSKGSLTMEFDGIVVKFEINKPNSHSPAESPPKDQRCVILWDHREDAEASRGLE
ncbi:uncharacterized protein LOC141630992 [Silene latifolia]|uniref:uncharacterized protein LOC141630992 n=1 Tax=Silene latifolia TaxID=37657 RepID=UPI003D7721A9